MPFPLDDYMRRSIEQHFRKKKLTWSEDEFLSVLQSTPRKYDALYAVIALRGCGTSRSIPTLREYLEHPMADVKVCSLLTIAQIAREKETQFYGETLISPTWRDKGYALWAIDDAADSRAVDYVLHYFNKNRSKFRRGLLDVDIIQHGFSYLWRNRSESKEVQSFLADVVSDWSSIDEETRVIIKKSCPELSVST